MGRAAEARGEGKWQEPLCRACAQACAMAPIPKGRGEWLDESGLLPARWLDPEHRQRLLSAPGPTRSSRAHL